MENQPTNQDILEAISEFSSQVDEKFVKVNERFNKIESIMVTKDHLDEKISDLRGDLLIMSRKEDRKLNATISLLTEKHLITEDEAKNLLAMEPFPQLSL